MAALVSISSVLVKMADRSKGTGGLEKLRKGCV